jgi:hypothetical protein
MSLVVSEDGRTVQASPAEQKAFPKVNATSCGEYRQDARQKKYGKLQLG